MSEPMSEPMVPYSLYLPRDWWERIDRSRQDAGRPEFLRDLIRRGIDNTPRRDPLSEPRPIGRPKEAD